MRTILLALLLAIGGCRSAQPPATPHTAPPSPDAATTRVMSTEAVAQPQPITTSRGRVISIIDSGDLDTYDAPSGVRARAVPSDLFEGSDRRAAKLSIVSAPEKVFGSVQELITSLLDDDDMRGRQPPISRARTSRRVVEERRNVAVTALLCAASREDDNDYHLIVCDDPRAPAEDRHCLNVEVTGLPPSGSHRTRLKAARDEFVALVQGHTPGRSYAFYDPPLPVQVAGSLFYDIRHPPGVVMPQKLRPATAWEIHPVTGIVERE